MRRIARRALLLIVGAVLIASPQLRSADIDFEGLPEGYVLDDPLFTGFGISGDLSGMVSIFGFNPAFGAGTNAAIVFASDCPPSGTTADCSGGDVDLGSPNSDFGGPGIDADGDPTTGGNQGSDFENDMPLGNVAIVAEDLVDTNPMDGNVDDPDDADLDGQFIEFDFTDLNGKGITVNSLTYMDNDEGEFGAQVEFFGPGTLNPSTIGLTAVGDNGVRTITPGIEGVEIMRVVLNGSGAVDNVVIEEEVERDCWVTLGGFNKGEVETAAGKKYCTFGGNVGPPPSGALEVNWHETGDPALDGARFHTNGIESVRCEDLTNGPGQPGGKKGLVEDTLFFTCSGRFNNQTGFNCRGYFQDNGEPQGKKVPNDKICVEVTDSNGAFVASCGEGCDPVDPAGGSVLVGGNVQIHPPVGKP